VNQLGLGDDVLMHVQAGYVTRAWFNLRRIRGVISGGHGGEYLVHGGYGYSQHSEFGVYVTAATSLTRGQGGTPSDMTRLPVGTSVDAIGLMDGGVLTATLLGYGLPGATTQSRGEDKPMSVKRSSRRTALGALALCDTTYWGYATWYYRNSAAKCGTCSYSSGSLAGQGACAWPKVSTNGLCDVTSGCKNQSAAWCGKDIDVYDRCSGTSLPCAVVDCGPCQTGCQYPLCGGAQGNVCSDCLTSYTPIVDLTRSTFSIFYDPSTHGCFAAKCVNTVSC
jgi:hypothetical protein